MKLSVLMSIYDRESPAFLRQCLESLTRQTRPADEVVLVEDGPLGEPLQFVIDQFRGLLPIISMPLPRNVGLGAALRAGLGICRGEFVARMDSDDVAVPRRFEQQLEFLARNPRVAVVGGAIAEFTERPEMPHSIRRLPASADAVQRFARFRNPLNHMTVLFGRETVELAGGYQVFDGFEDYHLWARMLRLGFQLENMPEVLVLVRCGNGMQNRRGGFAYLKQEVAFQRFLRRTGLVEASASLRNLIVRVPIRIAPPFVRSFCYACFLRDPAGEEFRG
jgi:O104-antigen biosynthesis beta-1,3-galactosyltransferase